ncbi:MAG TPA: GNAT family N-acetyltransferase [Xanthobacteraceae bacterium]|nr:GNAT family N-acetyltransferase [Xanthobacteraceae bacterium]HWW49350.1 GNAT family N-acetyltransferase [Xanthobacteraceae bacterium]
MLQETPGNCLSRGSCTFVLETERLTLRQPTLADVKAIAVIADDRRIAENTRKMPHPYTEADAEAFVASAARSAGKDIFLITDNDAPLGAVTLSWDDHDGAELDFWLGVEHWNRGLTTEAVRAVIDYAFNEFAFVELTSGARVINPASRRILEKCGFQWTGVELHRIQALGSSTPMDRFRLDRGVWASLKRWQEPTRRVLLAG